MIFWRLFEVLFLGFVCGLIPGPVVTAVFAETIQHGWLAARRIVLWAAAGEALMSVVCVGALSAIPPASPLFSYLSLAGAALLLFLSWNLWKVDHLQTEGTIFTNGRVFILAILNGMAWVFWITVCTPQAVALDALISGGRWLFILLFELGWLLSTFSLCLFFGLFRPYFRDQKKLHLLYRTIALVFVLFAVKLAMASAPTLLH